MNINKIKQLIEYNLGKEVMFRINGNRNQVDEFRGKIINAYKAIFLVKVENDPVIKSFTYTDVLIGNLEINV